MLLLLDILYSWALLKVTAPSSESCPACPNLAPSRTMLPMLRQPILKSQLNLIFIQATIIIDNYSG